MNSFAYLFNSHIICIIIRMESMTITWYGHSCFKIQTRNPKEELVIYIDPFDKSIGLRPPSGQGDIVLVTHDHYDHNNIKAIKGEPFVIEGPGEYEIKGINIQGISAFHDAEEGKERGLSTIYVIESEEIRICHLGDLGQKELTEEQLDKLDGVDVLMIPVGGIFTISGERASRLVNQLEPKIAIPMHYKIPGLNIKLEGIDNFLKAIKGGKVEPLEKLVIKKKELSQEETRVVVMKPI